MSRVSLIALLLLAPLGAESANYNVFLDERLTQASCDTKENKGNTPLGDLFDVGGVTSVLGQDYETIYLNGDVIVKKDLPREPIKFEADISRWDRGQWVPTVISLKRNDFCKSLKDPLELWHSYIVAQIPKEQLKCPPKAGNAYRLHNATNRLKIKNMPRWNYEGNLKAVVHLSVGDIKSCVLIFFTVSLI